VYYSFIFIFFIISLTSPKHFVILKIKIQHITVGGVEMILRDKLLSTEWKDLSNRSKVVGNLYVSFMNYMQKADEGSDTCLQALLSMSEHHNEQACTSICPFRERTKCDLSGEQQTQCIIDTINKKDNA
jgi:hypothetical protein